jgi:hypothetical protein
MQAKQCKACGAAYLGDHCVCTRVVKIDVVASASRVYRKWRALAPPPEVWEARAELRSTSELVDRLLARMGG